MTVTNKAFDLSAGGLDPKSTVGLSVSDTVTSTEQTLTVTPHPTKRTTIRIKGPAQPFGVSRVTGAIGTKQQYTVGTACDLVIPADPVGTPIVFFWQAVSTSDVLVAMAID